jgi:trk system potassium uptake protein
MHAIIGGCGRVGAQLAERLSSEGHDVVVVDQNAAAFERLGTGFNGDTLLGDFTDRETLVRAGIQRAEAVVAVTSYDNVNLMAVQIAQILFSVPRTVARLFNPAREESYRKMGVHYVSGTRLVAKAILNEIRDEAFPLHVAFPQADMSIVEMIVTREGHGWSIMELEQDGDVRVAAVKRGAKVRIPTLNDTVLRGDIVVAAITGKAPRRLRGIMGNPFDDAASERS